MVDIEAEWLMSASSCMAAGGQARRVRFKAAAAGRERQHTAYKKYARECGGYMERAQQQQPRQVIRAAAAPGACTVNSGAARTAAGWQQRAGYDDACGERGEPREAARKRCAAQAARMTQRRARKRCAVALVMAAAAGNARQGSRAAAAVGRRLAGSAA